MSDKYLVISAQGRDQPGIVNTLSKAALDCGCNINNSRMAVLGGEFALILLINGSANAIAAMQQRLPALEKELHLSITAKPTTTRAPERRWIPYRVEVIAMDHPGIVHPITEFFSAQNINIEELETETYAAPHTGATMFSLTMTVSVPDSVSSRQLRETFIDFCDELNLDASLETARD